MPAVRLLSLRRSARRTFGRNPPSSRHRGASYPRAPDVRAQSYRVRSEAVWQDRVRHGGRRPADIDVAQLYDCFTIVPLIELEELGFCQEGEGGAFFADGRASIGGKLPINTHGGMLSHAHAGAERAFRHRRSRAAAPRWVGERQVKDAELALVHNEGGILSSHCTLILGNKPH